jgi:iron complex outermembrane recepter protein
MVLLRHGDAAGRRRQLRTRPAALGIGIWLACAGGGWGQPPAKDLMDASIEELMNTQVVSVSKKSQRVAKTAAAVYVITQEEIRRSGVTSIPELLRMVPGVQVSRIDNSTWAISIRGFNDEFSNKLLVLVDGRSVYSELLSGVYWDQQEMLLDNVERIEVVRGPGAATWGANAVNGVINIITKNARATQGGLIAAGGSSEEQGPLAVRWGGKLGGESYYRVWGQYSRLDTLYPRGLASPAFDRGGGETGFRIDWEANRRNRFLAEGAAFRHSDRTLVPDVDVPAPLGATRRQREVFEGGHVLGRWSHTNSAASSSELQVYYDRADMPQYQIPFSASTVDVDFHQQHGISDRHQVSWGAGYRSVRYSSDGVPNYRLVPPEHATNLFSFFAQDEVSLLPDRLSLTGGIKLEHNSFTGLEWEPTARLLWSHGDRAATWAAVSRAARTPSLGEQFVSATILSFPDPASGMNVLLGVAGNPRFQSEYLTAYEAGHRIGLGSRIYADLSLFWNRYSGLSGLLSRIPQVVMAPVPHILFTEEFQNGFAGDAYGGELAVNYAVNTRWRLNAGYSRLHVSLSGPAGLTKASVSDQNSSPRNQFEAGSLLDLRKNVDLDVFVYMMGKVLGAPATFPGEISNGVPAYVRADLRLGWRPREHLELSLGGQNLLSPRHLEQISYHVGVQSEVGRTVIGNIKWSF